MLVRDKHRIDIGKGKTQSAQGFFNASRADSAIYENICFFRVSEKAVSRRPRKKCIRFQDENPFFISSNHHEASSQKMGTMSAIIISERILTAFLRFGTLSRNFVFLSGDHSSGRSASVGISPRLIPELTSAIVPRRTAESIV